MVVVASPRINNITDLHSAELIIITHHAYAADFPENITSEDGQQILPCTPFMVLPPGKLMARSHVYFNLKVP